MCRAESRATARPILRQNGYFLCDYAKYGKNLRANCVICSRFSRSESRLVAAGASGTRVRRGRRHRPARLGAGPGIERPRRRRRRRGRIPVAGRSAALDGRRPGPSPLGLPPGRRYHRPENASGSSWLACAMNHRHDLASLVVTHLRVRLAGRSNSTVSRSEVGTPPECQVNAPLPTC
jgi:hypothetical protein